MTAIQPEFFAFIESSLPNVPHTEQLESKTLYVDLPNKTVDPIRAQRLIEAQLEMLVRAEQMGFDGTAYTEHHNSPIGLISNSMMGASWLASRTDRIKIGINGPLINAYHTPIRLAEEIAVADIMSKGRMVIGLPMGVGQQYHALGLNPATARARHAEAHDLLVAALTQPGPFSWRGRFFNHEYVNLWPRPEREIEFILPGGGSLETLKLAAKRRYTYQTVLNNRQQQIAVMNRFRELCREEGYEPDPRQSAIVVEVHVAETDALARQESESEYLWNYQNYFRAPFHDNFPPGYTSPASLRNILSTGFLKDPQQLTWEDLIANKWIAAGSPETVRRELEEVISETGAGRVVLVFTFGAKPRWMLEKSMGLFAEQVLPHFRTNGKVLSEDEPKYGYRTVLEYAAKVDPELVPPTIIRDGHLYDVDKARYSWDDARLTPIA